MIPDQTAAGLTGTLHLGVWGSNADRLATTLNDHRTDEDQ